MNELFDMQHKRGEQPEQLHEQWANETAKKKWNEALQVVRRRWREIEWRSVAAGLRECALMPLADAELPAFAETLTAADLDLVPLQRIAATGNYANRLIQARKGEAGMFFCLISHRRYTSESLRLWQGHSHAALGRLLGYPDCCIAFFEQVWSSFSDTTWPMARNTPGHAYEASGLRCVVSGPWQTNVLLRWLGVRAVPHFPCSFSCEATVRFANTLAAICPNDGGDLCEEILRWPVEWSAMNGCAEIRTSEVTIVTSTDITHQRHSVQRIESTEEPMLQCGSNYAQATSSSRIVHPVLREK
jgi:hypothetical protein